MRLSNDVNTSVTVSVQPSAPMTIDRVLRRLEVVRQILAVRWCGKAGVFAGYDTLEIHERSEVSQGEVTFMARMVSAADGYHRVELQAWRREEVSGAAAQTSALILKGVGMTLEIGATSSVTAPPTRGTSRRTPTFGLPLAT